MHGKSRRDVGRESGPAVRVSPGRRRNLRELIVMRIYFCSDLHGSTTCWLKFLSSAKFYKADVVMVGGDITGKFVTPILKQADGTWTAELMGRPRQIKSEEELAQFEKSIAHTGAYPFRTTKEEADYISADSERVEALFKKLVVARVQEWVDMAETRLKGTGIRCLVQPGNDDAFEIDAVLEQSELIENPDGKVIDFEGDAQIIGLGYCNMTPWNCPRDIPEEEIGQRIEAMASQLANPDKAVFDFHVPPYGSTLDSCPRLNDDLSIIMTSSGPEIAPAGSTAVRAAIEKYQPLLGLHGHIHESKGSTKIGRTTCVNPGSEYGEGVLDGMIIEVDFKKNKVKSAQLVSG
jgi:uncharacterized protein